jgi:STE24 endopeptidase
VPIVGEALVFLPFVVMQLACWWGLYAGERALRSGLAMGRPASAAGHVLRRARQTLGLVLPALVVFTLGQRLIEWAWPAWSAGAWGQALQVASMGALVLVLSPLFLRLAWPTHPLPPGPLRSRLEHLARRLGFRCTDILIWDTGQGVVNACVTGSLPWFRYVLLTDALVEYLDEHEVAAVFGHEIGHIAHRHLLYFGFFFAGSLGVLALLGKLVDDHPLVFADLLTLAGHPMLAEAAKVLTVLAAVLLYFLVVFGHVSRRFERQADVFGCRAVSCGQIDCPPHADLDGSGHLANASSGALCPVGIRIFANALASVASLNGIEPNARSWRHGSIARRIAFLEALEGEPAALRRFQAGVAVLRVIVAIALVGAVLLALATGSIDHLR